MLFHYSTRPTTYVKIIKGAEGVGVRVQKPLTSFAARKFQLHFALQIRYGRKGRTNAYIVCTSTATYRDIHFNVGTLAYSIWRSVRILIRIWHNVSNNEGAPQLAGFPIRENSVCIREPAKKSARCSTRRRYSFIGAIWQSYSICIFASRLLCGIISINTRVFTA